MSADDSSEVLVRIIFGPALAKASYEGVQGDVALVASPVMEVSPLCGHVTGVGQLNQNAAMVARSPVVDFIECTHRDAIGDIACGEDKIKLLGRFPPASPVSAYSK